MAWLEKDRDRNGQDRYHLCFRYGGKRHKGALRTTSLKEARAVQGGADKILHQLETGLRNLPANADLLTFVLSGGALNKVEAAERLTLRRLFRQYLRHLPDGAMEQNSLDTVKMHLRHVLRFFGRKYLVHGLTLEELQRYVNKRLTMKGRRGSISPTTIKKEITTLSGVWTWAARTGKVAGPLPRGLRYPKRAEQPPFQTMAEITAHIAKSSLSANEQAQLWSCLFLTLPEIAELLQYVEAHARHGFVYPLFVMAAHTGARRSELLRLEVHDIDFTANTVTIREKKRARGKLTTRRVPLSPLLREVMREWLFRSHPGGTATFCHELLVCRSKKQRAVVAPLTKDEANDHFHRTLQGSNWEVIPGFHCLRHSFITNAACSVDQRLIDLWVGHTSEATRRRYRHLVPDVSQRALTSVFGRRQQPLLPKPQKLIVGDDPLLRCPPPTGALVGADAAVQAPLPNREGSSANLSGELLDGVPLLHGTAREDRGHDPLDLG